jgi:hypothetical protein
MDTSEAWKYERDWKEYRRKPIGELLQLKFLDMQPYTKTLAEMELERRAFVRDKLIDRILSASAIVISVIALMLRF